MPEGKLIYVVDDEKIIADTVALIMRSQGFRAKAFYSPHALLESLGDEIPDLVISDVVMPEMTGIELVVQLENLHANVKSLLISGQAHTSQLLAEARVRGQNLRVLAKPIHPTNLIAHVRAAVESRDAVSV